MSSALPSGMPSAMSNRTISPSSFRPASRASVPPIWPAPTSAIFLRAMKRSSSVMNGFSAFRGRPAVFQPLLRQLLPQAVDIEAEFADLQPCTGLRLLAFTRPAPAQHVAHQALLDCGAEYPVVD